MPLGGKNYSQFAVHLYVIVLKKEKDSTYCIFYESTPRTRPTVHSFQHLVDFFHFRARL